MTATHAQIANDMAAIAGIYERRDKRLARACRDAAVMIRDRLEGAAVDGRAWAGLHGRLMRLETCGVGTRYGIAKNLLRARLALEELARKGLA